MKKKVIIAVLSCLASIAVLSAGLWIHEKNVSVDSKTMPSNIIVNGIDVSDMSKKEAKQELVDQANKEGFEIKGIDPTVLPMDDTKYKIMDSLDNCVADQGFFKYIGHLFGKGYDITVPMKVSKTSDAFKEAFDAFVEKENKGTTRSENAYVDMSTNEFNVVDAVYGDNLDKKKLKKAILSKIENRESSIDYQHKDFVEIPEITKDSEEIQEKLDYCNKYLKTKITYTFGNKTHVITPAELDKMVTVKDGEIKVKKKAAQQYISDMAAKYDTYYLNRSFKTTSGRTVTLKTGNYGYIVDQAGEYKQLRSDIKGGKDVEREPVYARKGYSRNGVNDIPSSYIEVDLSEQHVYVYKNGNRVVSTPCVSGCLKPDKVGDVHGTVCGVFTIAYKERDATLRGGSKEDETDYESEVRYWMPFYDGIGLHDADWRDKFGGNIYKTDGSHGCINLPVSAAEKIFNNIEAGTVVIVYY